MMLIVIFCSLLWFCLFVELIFFFTFSWVLQHFSELPKSNGYFIIEANGGLNQQRLSVGFISIKLSL